MKELCKRIIDLVLSSGQNQEDRYKPGQLHDKERVRIIAPVPARTLV
jgi:hypothetical protein